MFLNPIASPLDEPFFFYLHTRHYLFFNADVFWQTAEYNINLSKF